MQYTTFADFPQKLVYNSPAFYHRLFNSVELKHMRIVRSIALHVLIFVLALVPAMTLLENVASAFSIQAAFEDRATIDVTRFNVSEGDLAGGDASELGVTRVNALLNEQMVGKYKDAEILSDSGDYIIPLGDPGENTLGPYTRRHQGCESKIQYQETRWKFTQLQAYTPGRGCFDVLSPSNDPVLGGDQLAGGLVEFTIFMRWVNASTLTLVDSSSSEYSNRVEGNDNQNKYFRVGDDECHGYVTVAASGTTGQYHGDCGYFRTGSGTFTVRIVGLADRANPGTPPGAGVPGGPGADGEDAPSCEEENPGISLSWFLCSVINFFDNTVQGLTNTVDDLLQIDSEYYTNDDLKQAWSYFRNIASFLLIIIGLVMIIGQAITKG